MLATIKTGLLAIANLFGWRSKVEDRKEREDHKEHGRLEERNKGLEHGLNEIEEGRKADDNLDDARRNELRNKYQK